jgi:hypothetical protein
VEEVLILLPLHIVEPVVRKGLGLALSARRERFSFLGWDLDEIV